jgi:alanyl-tRNA synthetase
MTCGRSDRKIFLRSLFHSAVTYYVIMTTERLYDTDHYLRAFTAKVVGFRDGGVLLDRTAFYAEAGGQAGDTGALGSERVVDTRIGEDGVIVHVMEDPPGFKVGDVVEGVINWERRYRIMRLHTASHIMEYFLWKRYGYMRRTGSFVDEKKDRADYVHEDRLDPETLKGVESDTNAFLLEGHPVEIEIDDEGMRHWSCGPVEMLCAGTHVRNTGEIGTVKLRRRNPGRGEERVETSLAE